MANELKPQLAPSSVRRAREAIMARAHEIFEAMMLNAKMAATSGDYETAHKAYQYLLDHAAPEDGERVVEPSVDKPKQLEARPSGPQVFIGLRLGGTVGTKELEESTIIDVTPVNNE